MSALARFWCALAVLYPGATSVRTLGDVVFSGADVGFSQAEGSAQSTQFAASEYMDSIAGGDAESNVPPAASAFLRKLAAGSSSGLPAFNFSAMAAPGASNKASVQDMHVVMKSVSFSIPGDSRTFSSKTPESDAGSEYVTKALCVFVNPGSGGRQGAQLMSFGQGLKSGRVRDLVMTVRMSEVREKSWWDSGPSSFQDSLVQVLFFEMTNTCSRAAGIYALRRLRKERNIPKKPDGCAAEFGDVDGILDRTTYQPWYRQVVTEFEARAAAAGGDGTITWLIDELYKVADPPVRVPVGVIPLGTGNDLSRQLNTPAGISRCKGAGSADVLASMTGALAGAQGTMEVTAKLMLAPTVGFDIWNVDVTTNAGGDLKEMRQGNLQSVGFRCVKRVGERCEQMQQTMGNYASVGFESMIGLDFENWRSSQTDNSQFANKAKYAELGAAYAFGQSASPSFPFLKYMPLNTYVDTLQDGNSHLVGETPEEILSYGCDPRQSTAMGSYKSLMFMNVECVMGGERKWPRSASFPVQPHFDDGRLEVLSFRSPVTMAAVSGKLEDSCAVGQYGTPEVLFQSMNATMAYQVDGEFYAGINLQKMAMEFRERVLLIKLGKGDKSKVGNPTIRFR